MDDLISVIVPVFNCCDYIKECVLSITSQEYKSLEIILLDDGSEDGSGEICDELADSDNRIVVIHQENKGQAVARNNGLKRATGAYIGFVDSDDTIEPDMYSLLHECCEKYNAQIAAAGFNIMGFQNNRKFTNKVMAYDTDEYLYNMIDDRFPYETPSVWKRLYRRKVVEELFFPESRFNEDTFFSYSAIAKSNRCVYVDRALYNYREHDDSLTGVAKRVKNLDDTTESFLVLLSAYESLEKGGYGMHACLAMTYSYYGVSRWYIRNKDLLDEKNNALTIEFLLKLKRNIKAAKPWNYTPRYAYRIIFRFILASCLLFLKGNDRFLEETDD